MGKTLYLDCSSGISGDMTVAALLDLGADQQALQQVLDTIPADGFEIRVSRVKKAGLDCCDFDVCLDAAHENHDHDMAYLYGHEQSHVHTHSLEHTHDHVHEHAHDHEQTHSHDHAHDHEHTHGHGHVHPHEHRGLKEVIAILDRTKMTEGARALAGRIFDILADAESKAHGVPKDEVHFHEVGAIDSIVDIVSVAVCIDQLGIDRCIIPHLCEGTGTIRCQHGILPVPVPAVAAVVAQHGLNLQVTEVRGELVTPTGAAIAAALKTSDVLPKEFGIKAIGLGAGKREYERPGILRAMIIEPKKNADDSDEIVKLESNIDDCSGEVLGFVMDRLFAAGARDVHYHPVYMKKNRPGWQLNVICTEDKVEELERIIFNETTTIGIRRCRMERSILRRRADEVTTEYGTVLVKVVEIDGRERIYPEYDSVAALSEKTGVPFQNIYHAAMQK